MSDGWVIGSRAGPATVEKLAGVRRSFQTADLSEEPRAVMHTTEGGWGSSLGVFARTGTPTFMVGRDSGSGNRVRAAQFMPIGEMALTLQNDAGGVETNRYCRAQIEIVGFSQRGPWLPDGDVTAALADLMRIIRDVGKVPLVRGGDGTRSTSRWLSRAGWFGHSEVPENDHWDPGALRWDALFALAGGGSRDTTEGGIETVAGWTIEQILDLFEWRVVNKRTTPRPNVPGKTNAEVEAVLQRIHRLAKRYGPDVTFLDWARWVFVEQRQTERPEGVPARNLGTRWWTGATIVHSILNAYAEKLVEAAIAGEEAEQATILGKLAQAEERIRALQAELENEGASDAEREARIRALAEQILAELGGST